MYVPSTEIVAYQSYTSESKNQSKMLHYSIFDPDWTLKKKKIFFASQLLQACQYLSHHTVRIIKIQAYLSLVE